MWQITWMLSLLPNWFWLAVLIIGVAGVIAAWFLKFIPFVKTYRLPIQIVSVVLLLIGTFSQGMIWNEEKWQVRVKELEAKVAEAEAQSKKVNTVIVEKIVKQREVVQGKTEYITRYIDREIVKDREVVKFIENCPLPPAIIDAHNAAAQLNQAAQGAKK